MKKIMNYALIAYFLVFVFCDFGSINAADIQTIKVGTQPIAINYDNLNKIYHVFCLGKDVNFNGEYDSLTDEKSSWWKIEEKNGQYLASKILDFENAFLNFPLRLNFLDINDYNPRTVFIPFNNSYNNDFTVKKPGKIVSYDLDNFKVIDNNVLGYFANSVSSYGPHLLISKNLESGKSGKVAVFNLSTKSSLQEISAGINANNAYAYTGTDGKLRCIATSDDYSDSSTFHFSLVPHMSDFKFKNFKIGKTVNHIAQNKDNVIITCNESHNIYVFNSALEVFTNIISTETSGLNGPRESLFLDDKTIAVTTYNGDLLIIDITKGNIINKFKLKAIDDKNESLEGMVYNENKLFICNPFTNYNTNNSKVYIISNPLNKTEVENNSSNIEVYPNPASDYIFINSISNYDRIEIVSQLGINYNISSENNYINLKTLNLVYGVYYIKLHKNNMIEIRKLIISKN